MTAPFTCPECGRDRMSLKVHEVTEYHDVERHTLFRSGPNGILGEKQETDGSFCIDKVTLTCLLCDHEILICDNEVVKPEYADLMEQIYNLEILP